MHASAEATAEATPKTKALSRAKPRDTSVANATTPQFAAAGASLRNAATAEAVEP